MAIEFLCPVCGSTLRVAHETGGRLVRCGHCMSMLRVPEVEPTPRLDSRPEEVPAPSGRPVEQPRPLAVSVPTPPRSLFESENGPPTDQPKPRRTLFWLFLLAGLSMAGMVACCLGIFLVMPPPNWQPHESGPGGFTVEFPAEPQPGITAPGLKADAETKVLGVKMRGRDEVYAVSYQSVPPPGRRLPDDVFLATQIKLLEGNSSIRRILRTESLTVSGFPAREVEFVAANGGTYVLRLVIAETRVYRVIAGGRAVSADHANVRRFLDSFAVTDPELVGRGKNRADPQPQTRQAQTQAAGQAIAAAALRSVERETARVAARTELLAAARSTGAHIAEVVLATLPHAPELPVAPPPRGKG